MKDLLEDYIQQVKDLNLFSVEEISRILSAAAFAINAHEGQLRKTGEPYVTHPFRVSIHLSKLYNDIDLTIAGILHDVVEDSWIDCMPLIYKKFGHTIWFLVDSVTKTTNHYHLEPDHFFEDKVSKILFWWMQDVRCFLLKLADREDNLFSVQNLKNEKQIRLAFETQAIYIPLKNITHYGQPYSLSDIDRMVLSYLHENGISNFSEFKDHLLKNSFFDMDDDTFECIYKNSSKIVRKIEDETIFAKLLEDEEFSKNIKIISMNQWSSSWFFCAFYFTWAYIAQDRKLDIRLHKNIYISK